MGGQNGIISQNIIRNCQGRAAFLSATSGGTIQFLANQIGECGMSLPGGVIEVTLAASPGGIPILNNVYAGHQNTLTSFIDSIDTLSFVSGNVQTQTTLPNNLP